MDSIIKPAPGFFQRWNRLLFITLAASGALILFGEAALMLDEYLKPDQRELAVLEFKIGGEVAEVTEEDFAAHQELESKLGALEHVDFEELGRPLVEVSVPIFLYVLGVLLVQWVLRWLWFGLPRKTV